MTISSEAAYFHDFVRRLRETDVADLRIKFDADSDELLLLLSRERIPAVSVPVIADFSVRMTPDRSRPIGLMIENTLSRAVYRHPWIIDLFDVAETGDLPDATIMRIRRERARREAVTLEHAWADQLALIAS